MKTRFLLTVLYCFVVVTCARAAEPPAIDRHLEPLRPLVGKTWKGEFKNSTPEKPVIDIMQCERALNGKAIRSLHSINNGEYGGETIFMWDEAKQEVRFHYFTTAGFMTTGAITFKDDKWITHETVSGNAGGITEVRGTSEMLPDGTLRVTTEYLKGDKWEPGRETIYREDADAKVVFK
jgi:hypothetical protein